jgi:fibulin 1/2
MSHYISASAPDVPQPFIQCPQDVKIDLPPHQNFVHVRIPQPKSNMDWWRWVSQEAYGLIHLVSIK